MHDLSNQKTTLPGDSSAAVSGGLNPHKSGGDKWRCQLAAESGGHLWWRMLAADSGAHGTTNKQGPARGPVYGWSWKFFVIQNGKSWS
jgi:hypothetical protein